MAVCNPLVITRGLFANGEVDTSKNADVEGADPSEIFGVQQWKTNLRETSDRLLRYTLW